MRELLFMPCSPPPKIIETLASIRRGPTALYSNPRERGLRAFQHSLLATLGYLFLLAYGSRAIGLVLSQTFGIAPGVLTLVLLFFFVTVFSYAGVQCTVWAFLVVFLVITEATTLLARQSRTAAGAALGLDELPGAEGAAVDDCMRLAACRASPVFTNSERALEKARACDACVAEGKLFTSRVADDGTLVGYTCLDKAPPFVACDGGARGCAPVADALEVMRGERPDPASVTAACEASQGTLCYFARTADGELRGYAGTVDADATDGLGYPTQTMCEAHNGGAPCERAAGCATRAPAYRGANCFCEQYRATRRAANPCAFLETKCEMSSPRFKQAEIQIQQQRLDVSEIVDADDFRQLVVAIDKALLFA